MRLESAMFASKEGLTAHGIAISVIGDNISNSNTVGFKAARTEFGDLLSEGSGAARSESMQAAGNGVQVARVRTVHETGVIEDTGRSLDIAIEGRGFIMVGDADNPNFTRAGTLAINSEGVLVEGNNLPVLGFISSTGQLGQLDIDNLNLNGVATTSAQIFGNLSSDNEITTVPTGEDADTFKEIDQSASFTAEVRVFDSLGGPRDLSLAFYRTDASEWTAVAYIDGGEVTGGTEGAPVQLGTTTMTFDSSGQPTGTATMTVTPEFNNGAATGNITIDLSGFTQFAGATQVSSIVQNGQSAGNIQDYEVKPDGRVFALLDSGTPLLLGTLQLADFSNVDSLERVGNNLFARGPDSGEIRLGAPGSNGFGTLNGGALERSTVDIATEFVELVLYQRGYQASSQTLSTANDMIRDTLNLLR
ncbi:MAG: flagellar hook protein FlgE [Candidatus Dadabacteria bacterium]|nr:MAG: flagellar hook protein FlgE [Candidatus Dadabacteria bacterium]